MEVKKTMKAASPLGGLIFAIGIVMIAAFGITGFVGYYELGTGGAINPYLSNQINALKVNQSNPTTGTFNNLSALSAQNHLQAINTGNIIGSISAAATAAGSAFSYTSFIVNFLNPANAGSFINVFIVAPLTLLGIPAGFAALTAYMILLAMLILLIFSALLIFNLL